LIYSLLYFQFDFYQIFRQGQPFDFPPGYGWKLLGIDGVPVFGMGIFVGYRS